jgi:cytoskeletal protein CcmA (bactofilin family)
VTQAATLDDTLTVAGNTTLQSDLQVDGAANVDGTLDVTQAATLDDTLTVAGATTLNNTLDVTGVASFHSNAQFDQDVNIDGRLDVADDVYVAGRSQGLQSQIDSLSSTVDKNTRGIAMTAALSQTTVLPGMSNALDVNAATFAGETGLAITYSRRVSDNIQLNFGAATTTDLEEAVVRAGVGVQW